MLLGEPVIIVKHGKIISKNLLKERISIIQLTSILRAAEHLKLEDIQHAILEPTGEISVITKAGLRAVTLSDLDLKAQYEGLSIMILPQRSLLISAPLLITIYLF